ncbi:MAG: Gramicidin S synthase 1 [Firmicutes bacterium ADurb.Bin419]|nr:MAG: Gramicidin S synthase 1 [Firmicutes bacterium ADurb.Bin419]
MAIEKPYWEEIENTLVEPLPKDSIADSNKVKDGEDVTITFAEEETQNLLKNVNHAYNTEINDILLTALVKTVGDFTGRDKVLINLEGHGRESIIEGLDISRTIGWFTSTFPVVLETYKEKDISYRIKSVKESIRRIPNKGIGYGLLKYLASDENGTYSYKLAPQISFNYMGQFNQDGNMDGVSISKISSGDNFSLDSERLYDLDINGMIREGKLMITINYNRGEYNLSTISGIANSFRDNLHEIIEHCGYKKEAEITPHDLGTSDISLEELDDILEAASLL